MRHRVLIVLILIGVIASQGALGTMAYFSDSNQNDGNTFEAWVCNIWTQTTQADFEAGVPSSVDTSSSPGDVKLAMASNWYDTNWQYRRAITLNTATTVSNYQVLVTLTTAEMGNPYTNVKSDGSDIRFTGSDGITLQDYWIESWDNTGISEVWVEVAATGTSVIYMYYGNVAASSASNADATFLFYDGFESGTIDSKWTDVAGAGAASWTFNNALDYSYNSTQIEVVSGYAQLIEGSSPEWWDTSYAYRRQITIQNNTASALPAGYSSKLTLDHASLVVAGKAQASGDDVRMVYWNGGSNVELDRVAETPWNTGSTEIWYKTQANIPGSGSDNNYYLYYGNASAINAPANGSNVYFFEDLFNRTASSTVGNGWTELEVGGADARIAANSLVPTNVLDLYGANLGMDTIAQHDITGLTDLCVWEFGFVWDRSLSGENSYEVYMQVGDSANLSDTSPWLGVGPFLSWTGTETSTTIGTAATAHEMLRVFDSDQIPTEVEVTGGAYDIKLVMDRGAGTFVLYKDGVLKGSYNVYQNVSKWDTVRFVSDYINPANGVPDRGFDYVRFYFAASVEPTVTAGAEVPPSFPSDTPTLQPVTGQPYTAEILTFAEVLGPANQGAVRYQISNNGTGWYYHNGANWVVASGFAQTNTAPEVNANISSFDDDVGTGTFYFKAFLSSDGSQQVQLDEVSIGLASFWSRATDQSRSGTYSMKAGVTSGSNEYIAATGIDEADVIFDAWWYNTATTSDICQSVRANTVMPLNDYHVNWEGQWTIAEMPWNPLSSVAGSLPQSTWFKMTVVIQGTSMKALLDDVQINPASGWLDVGTNYASGSVGFRSWTASNNWWIDDVRVRRYTDPEPTASVGAEEGQHILSGTLASQVLDTGIGNATWHRLLWDETVTSKDWFNNNWQYRRAISLSPATSVDNYQVLITLTTAVMGNPYSNINADGSDIRFTGANGVTLQDYWIESWDNTGTSYIWVEVSTLGTSTIYMYYGNTAASSPSDGTSTFDFFDDFSGDLSKWTIDPENTDTVYIDSLQGNSAPALRHDPDSSQTKNSYFDTRLMTSSYTTRNGIIEYDVFLAGAPRIIHQLGFRVDSLSFTNGYCWRMQNSATDGGWFRFDNGSWSKIGTDWGPTTGGVWHSVKMEIVDTNFQAYIDGGGAISVTDTSKQTEDYLISHVHGVSLTASSYVLVDNVRVRKYASVEPTASVGTEDSKPAQVVDITFEVRASDTPFLKGDGTPAWTPVGGTSPVTSGLPSGRYMQWRVTLTTSDPAETPALHEVTVHYY